MIDNEFQSTPLCEGRLPVCKISIASSAVSIHAPVRGATPLAETKDIAISFNPRPCARGDKQQQQKHGG